MNPAIIIVAYNRPDSMRRLLQSVNDAYYERDDVELVISIDKSDNIDDVLLVAQSFEWSHGHKRIRVYPERQGLRKHILQCGDLCEEYGSVIVLEDDLVVSPGFYFFVQKALDYYHESDEVTGIALYSHEWNGYGNCFFFPVVDEYDTFLGQFSVTWGQCWTKKWWDGFKTWYKEQPELLGDNPNLPKNINRWSKQSWGRYFANYITCMKKYYVIPRTAFSTNFSEIGQHVSNPDTDHQVRLVEGVRKEFAFAPVSKAERYDIFFENQNILDNLDKDLVAYGVDVDLSGYGRNNPNNRYIISTKPLPYKRIYSYGLMLRPIEMNVRKSIPGCDIYIYDKSIKATKGRYSPKFFRYEIRGMATKDILTYAMCLLGNKIKERILVKRRISH